MARCDCMIVKHPKACPKPAVYVCTTCNAQLCSPCAKQHHAHTTVEKLDVPRPR